MWFGRSQHNHYSTISERRPSSCKNVLHTFNNFVRHNPSLRLSMTFLNPPGYNNYLACWCSRCRAAMLACFRKPVHGFVSWVLYFVKRHAGFLFRVFPERPRNRTWKALTDFAVCDWWHYCKALCDVKFRQIRWNGLKFGHVELCIISVITLIF